LPASQVASQLLSWLPQPASRRQSQPPPSISFDAVFRVTPSADIAICAVAFAAFRFR